MNILNHQNGIVLVMAIIMLLVIGGISSSLLTESTMLNKTIVNIEKGYKAESIAESGLRNGFTQLVQVASAGSIDTYLTNKVLLTKTAYADGYYIVNFIDNDDGDNNPLSDSDDLIILQSIGVEETASRTIESYVALVASESVIQQGLIINGDLEISGSASLFGGCGSVHANKNLKIGGTLVADGSVTASGGIDDMGKVDSDAIDTGAGVITLPTVDPNQYRNEADYILAKDGKVYDKIGNMVADTNYNAWNGWEINGLTNGVAKWIMPIDETISNVTLFIEGDAIISGSPFQYSETDAWKISLISERSLEISGNPKFSPNNLTAEYSQFKSLQFVAGGDLKISGQVSITQKIEGFMIAHEQIRISGKNHLRGFLYGEDAQTDTSLYTDYASENVISGEFTHTTSGCGDESLISKTFEMYGWILK